MGEVKTTGVLAVRSGYEMTLWEITEASGSRVNSVLCKSLGKTEK